MADSLDFNALSLEAKERVLREYRGDLSAPTRKNSRPWKAPDPHLPVLPTQIPYLWKTSIPYKWLEITARPVQQVVGLYRDKRDTVEFLIEKQKLIHQISKSPIKGDTGGFSLAVRNLETPKRKNTLPGEWRGESTPAIQIRARTSPQRQLTRSSSLSTRKLPFEISPSKRRRPSPPSLPTRSSAPLPSQPTPSHNDTSQPIDFLITKYTRPAALVSQRRVRAKGATCFVGNRGIEEYLQRFEQTAAVDKPKHFRKGFSGFKLTLKREKKLQPPKITRVKPSPAVDCLPPSSFFPPSPTAHGELYLQYLRFKRHSRAQSSLC